MLTDKCIQLKRNLPPVMLHLDCPTACLCHAQVIAHLSQTVSGLTNLLMVEAGPKEGKRPNQTIRSLREPVRWRKSSFGGSKVRWSRRCGRKVWSKMRCVVQDKATYAPISAMQSIQLLNACCS